MKSKIEIIKHIIREIKEMHDLIEKECDDILNMTNMQNQLKPLKYDEVIKQFGEFEYKEDGGGRVIVTDNWRNENIIKLEINGLKIWCNKFVAPQFAGAFAEIIANELWNEIVLTGGGGCYCARHKNWKIKSTLSKHSWGIALDINPQKYPYGSYERMNQDVIEIFRKWGFFCGSDWRIPDPMHFEWCQFII